jgi:hypothetical protein
MAWDCSTDPEWQEQIDWIEELSRDGDPDVKGPVERMKRYPRARS